MALFPKIQSPCPYKANLSAVMDGDFCRMCKREVTDLTAMSDGERVAFLDACTGEVCVSYRVPVLAAAAVAALSAGFAMAAPAAADDMTVQEVIVGGIRAPQKVEYVQHADVAQAAMTATPDLPVIYDVKPATAATSVKPADSAPPAKASDASKPPK
jgi:predicted Fe-S protein YdhL (DUF1289 family)